MEKQLEKNFTFTWIIENFSVYSQTIESSKFNWDIPVEGRWYIKLEPYISNNDCVGVILTNSLQRHEYVEICYRLEVLDCKEKNILTIEKCMIGKENHLERKCFLPFLINDILILKLTFDAEYGENEQHVLPPLPYKNGLFADVVLRAGDVEFKVHKAILDARWPILAQKLDDGKTSEIVLDIGSDVLEAILKYVYTGKMDFKGYEFSAEVSAAALKYELPYPIYPPLVAMTCRTQINVDQLSFEWPIKNFSTLPVNTMLQSRAFSVDSLDNYKWYLLLHVSRDALHGRIFDISIRKEGGLKDILVKSKISFDESSSSENEHVFRKDEIWKCGEFSRTISTDPEEILRLNCELKFSIESYDSKNVKSFYDFASSANCRYIRRDLGALYRSRKSADVDIFANPLYTYSAHKFILSARSPVFSKMFESEVTESKNNSVRISHNCPGVNGDMLKFLYDNCLDINYSSTAVELYSEADKYDIPALKKKCFSWIKSQLGIYPIRTIVELTNKDLNEDLYDIVFEYITEHVDEVFSSDNWKAFCNNNTCRKLLRKAIIRNSPRK